MSNALAVSLLRKHVDDAAHGSVALVRRLRPKYAALPDADLLASVRPTLLGVADYLETSDDQPLIALVEGIIGARRESGFDALDFAVMSHCYLPPVRAVFVARAPTPVEGLAAYDAVEAVSLPLIERLLHPAVEPGGPFVAVYVRDLVTRSMRL